MGSGRRSGDVCFFAAIRQIRHRALAVSPAISGAGHMARCGERWRRFFPEKLPAAAVHAEATDLPHMLVFRKALTREQVGACGLARSGNKKR